MEKSDNYDLIFKILIAGELGSGRTRFLLRYVEGKFEDHFYSTDYEIKNKMVKSPDSNKSIKLQMWDVAGIERNRPLSSSYYRGCSGILILFDVTDRHSFQSVNRFFKESIKYCHINVQKILVATKTDETEKRVVTSEEAKELADQLGIPYIETSAKNDININEAFNMLVRRVEANYDKIQIPMPTDKKPPPDPTPQPRNKKCCIIM